MDFNIENSDFDNDNYFNPYLEPEGDPIPINSEVLGFGTSKEDAGNKKSFIDNYIDTETSESEDKNLFEFENENEIENENRESIYNPFDDVFEGSNNNENNKLSNLQFQSADVALGISLNSPEQKPRTESEAPKTPAIDTPARIFQHGRKMQMGSLSGKSVQPWQRPQFESPKNPKEFRGKNSFSDSDDMNMDNVAIEIEEEIEDMKDLTVSPRSSSPLRENIFLKDSNSNVSIPKYSNLDLNLNLNSSKSNIQGKKVTWGVDEEFGYGSLLDSTNSDLGASLISERLNATPNKTKLTTPSLDRLRAKYSNTDKRRKKFLSEQDAKDLEIEEYLQNVQKFTMDSDSILSSFQSSNESFNNGSSINESDFLKSSSAFPKPYFQSRINNNNSDFLSSKLQDLSVEDQPYSSKYDSSRYEKKHSAKDSFNDNSTVKLSHKSLDFGKVYSSVKCKRVVKVINQANVSQTVVISKPENSKAFSIRWLIKDLDDSMAMADDVVILSPNGFMEAEVVFDPELNKNKSNLVKGEIIFQCMPLPSSIPESKGGRIQFNGSSIVLPLQVQSIETPLLFPKNINNLLYFRGYLPMTKPENRRITVKNKSSRRIQISAIITSPSYFTVSPSQINVGPGESFYLDVSFYIDSQTPEETIIGDLILMDASQQEIIGSYKVEGNVLNMGNQENEHVNIKKQNTRQMYRNDPIENINVPKEVSKEYVFQENRPNRPIINSVPLMNSHVGMKPQYLSVSIHIPSNISWPITLVGTEVPISLPIVNSEGHSIDASVSIEPMASYGNSQAYIGSRSSRSGFSTFRCSTQWIHIPPFSTTYLTLYFSPAKVGHFESLLTLKAGVELGRTILSGTSDAISFRIEPIKTLDFGVFETKELKRLVSNLGNKSVDYESMELYSGLFQKVKIFNESNIDMDFKGVLSLEYPTMKDVPSEKFLNNPFVLFDPFSKRVLNNMNFSIQGVPARSFRELFVVFQPVFLSDLENLFYESKYSDYPIKYSSILRVIPELETSMKYSSRMECLVPISIKIGKCILRIPDYKKSTNNNSNNKEFAPLVMECLDQSKEVIKEVIPLYNEGTIPMEVNASLSNSSFFQVYPRGSFKIPPNSKREVEISFFPPNVHQMSRIDAKNIKYPIQAEVSFVVQSTIQKVSIPLTGVWPFEMVNDEGLMSSPHIHSLKFDKPCISWGGVAINTREKRSLQIRNDGDSKISLVLRIQSPEIIDKDKENFYESSVNKKNPFSLLSVPHVVIEPHSETLVSLSYSPFDVVCDRYVLIIQSASSGEKYRFPLLGYGGVSNIVVSHQLVDFGSVEEGIKPLTSIVVLENLGNRAGFCRFLCRDGLTSGNRMSVVPAAVVLSPGTVQEFKITYSPQVNDSKNPVWSKFDRKIEMYYGDELARIRRKSRKLRRRAQETIEQLETPHSGILKKLSENIDATLDDVLIPLEQGMDIFDGDFLHENAMISEEDIHSSVYAIDAKFGIDDFFDEELFETKLKAIGIRIVGEAIPRESMRDEKDPRENSRENYKNKKSRNRTTLVPPLIVSSDHISFDETRPGKTSEFILRIKNISNTQHMWSITSEDNIDWITNHSTVTEISSRECIFDISNDNGILHPEEVESIKIGFCPPLKGIKIGETNQGVFSQRIILRAFSKFDKKSIPVQIKQIVLSGRVVSFLKDTPKSPVKYSSPMKMKLKSSPEERSSPVQQTKTTTPKPKIRDNHNHNRNHNLPKPKSISTSSKPRNIISSPFPSEPPPEYKRKISESKSKSFFGGVLLAPEYFYYSQTCVDFPRYSELILSNISDHALIITVEAPSKPFAVCQTKVHAPPSSRVVIATRFLPNTVGFHVSDLTLKVTCKKLNMFSVPLSIELIGDAVSSPLVVSQAPFTSTGTLIIPFGTSGTVVTLQSSKPTEKLNYNAYFVPESDLLRIDNSSGVIEPGSVCELIIHSTSFTSLSKTDLVVEYEGGKWRFPVQSSRKKK